MTASQTPFVCIKCGKTGTAGEYTTHSRKQSDRIWHIDCSNPRLDGYDRELLKLKSTFFAKYPNNCSACAARIRVGDLAMIRDCKARHASCGNPTAAEGYTPPVNPSEPIGEPAPVVNNPEPSEPMPSIEVKAPKAPTSPTDGLLEVIVNRVGSALTDKVENAINEVKRASDTTLANLDAQITEKIGKISIPRIELVRPKLPTVVIDNVHKQFKSILEMLHHTRYDGQHYNLYIHGGPGGGKTHLGPQLAKALGVRYGAVTLSEQSPEYWISGYDSPIDGKHYPSMFSDFYRNGGLFSFIEADNANDNMRTALNLSLENGIGIFGGEVVKRHPDFYVIADGNTSGRGAHPAFPSRTPFDAAFAARFLFVEFEYDWTLCRAVTESINAKALPLVAWAESASAWALANGIPVIISPREVYTLADLLLIGSESLDNLFDYVLRGLDLVSKEKLLENFPLPAIN